MKVKKMIDLDQIKIALSAYAFDYNEDDDE